MSYYVIYSPITSPAFKGQPAILESFDGASKDEAGSGYNWTSIPSCAWPFQTEDKGKDRLQYVHAHHPEAVLLPYAAARALLHAANAVRALPHVPDVACPLDTNKDGDCHICSKLPGKCPNRQR